MTSILLSHYMAQILTNTVAIIAIVVPLSGMIYGACKDKSAEFHFAWIFTFFGLLLVAGIIEALDETKQSPYDRSWALSGLACGVILILGIAKNYRDRQRRKLNNELL